MAARLLIPLPDAEESRLLWIARQKDGTPSRLEQKVAEKKLSVVDEKAFLKAVRTRDQMHCRCCLRKVMITISLVPARAEVHHLHGRRGDFRFDDRFALLACKSCHEKLTGNVNEKWIAIGTVFIEIKGQPCIDARQPVTFQRVV